MAVDGAHGSGRGMQLDEQKNLGLPPPAHILPHYLPPEHV